MSRVPQYHSSPKAPLKTPPRIDGATSARQKQARTLHTRGADLLRRGLVADGIRTLTEGVALAPDYQPVRRELANAYFRAGRLNEALAHFNELTTQSPTNSAAFNNVAGVLSIMGHQELALQSVERALAIDPANTAAMSNLAEILKHLGDWQGTCDVYRAALALKPTDEKMRMQLGMALVALDEWHEGWAALESREAAIGAEVLYKERVSSPRWTGAEPLEGRTILIQHEQGLGDAIMCVRFARELAQRGAHVHVRCPAPLVALLSRIDGVSACSAVMSPMPPHDLHVPVMSLMTCLDTRPDDVDGAAYLTPEGPCPAHLDALLPRDGVPTVVIAWAGNPMHTNDHRRSIKGGLLAELLATPGIRFMAMQKTPDLATALPAELRPLITDLGAQCETFMDSAHALSRVDLVVAVDSAVAHLAGALGVPTLVCLPFAPDYRWGVTGTSTPWYDSVTVLRQQQAMQWQDVLETVRQRVLALR